MTIAFALAELGSAAPTAGGLYYWTHRYSSPRYKNLMAWLVGCMSVSCYFCSIYICSWIAIDVNTIGIIAGATGVDYACAIMIFSAVSIADSSFAATNHQILFVSLIQ
jgi:amino acid transporter